MIKIRLFCAAGMSTSLLVTKMKEAAKAMNIEADIAAAGETKMHDETDGIDVALLGPQIRFKLAETKGGDKLLSAMCAISTYFIIYPPYVDGNLSDRKDSVVILIGSGIGGALIKDGKVHFGRHGSAGEFSNIALSENVDMPGSLWYAQNGTPRLVQMVAGAKGIPTDQMNGRILFEQANAGDPMVLAALDRFTRGIVLRIFNLQIIYDPEKFAIGGISRQKLFLESIQKNLDEIHTIYPEKSFPHAQLTTCRFFNEANLYGAYRFFTEREKT